ncbi:MAG: NAD(P)/FAD-dependent oxidoreductase, partial [Lachnospiraceae bacterium]
MKKVLIIGGGAAGMLASIFAAKNGHEVHVYEKNGKLGKKLFITGKGRCNITNAADMDEVFSSVVTNPKFLYSSLYGFTNQNVIDFFESIGVTTKVERGERVFPASDRSGDVIQALTKEMKREGVNIHLSAPIKRILTEQGQFSGIETEDG